MERHRITLRTAFAAAVALAALCAAAPAAPAALLVRSADACAEQVYERPFLPWGDPMTYVLAPQGTIEQAGAWSLSGGAAPADGNERFYVHAPGERRSLALPAGARAVTGTMCVGIEHPTLRLFARNTGDPAGLLLVEVRFETSVGLRQSLRIGAVAAGREWAPTLPFPVVANLLPLLPGSRTPVQFAFTAVGGEWQIDDVYVDPYRK